MVEVIITTAVVTSIIVIMAQLAWVEVKRRARSRKRKIRRAVTKHSHKIFSRKPDYNVAPPWGRTVSLEEHRKQFSDSLFNQ